MWLITGLLLGAGIALGALWMRSRGVRTAWYEWALAACGVLLVMFAVENVRSFAAELETTAAAKSVLIFGLPGALLIIIAAALVFWRYRRSQAARRSGNTG
jgi:uncharacterized membrane protein